MSVPINPLISRDLLDDVVWTCHTFENNFGMKDNFTKYFNKSCRKNSDEQLSLKYFLNIAFIGEISAKQSGVLQA